MEVVVLPPQDCLKRAHHQHQQQRRLTNKPRRNPSPPSNPIAVNSTNHSSLRSNRRKPSASGPTKSQSRSVSPPLSGQIRILKRGENLPKPVKHQPQPQPQTARSILGPMINGFYAGSACVTSPPPSELPLPAFFTRSCGLSLVTDDVNNNQKIASDLRRVLKLC